MMKKSRRLFLPVDDFDVSLVKAQMSQQFVHGLGFCGSTQDAIINPVEIVEGTAWEISRAVRKEHCVVLLSGSDK